MNTFFIRHNTGMGVDDATRQRLWRERRIAIHFPHDRNAKRGARDSSSINPDDYLGTAKSRMRTLVELAKDGGYVCAQHYPHDRWMLGLVRPESKIELLKGRCIDGRRMAVLKTLRLSNVRLVHPLDYAVLSVGRPRQGTVTRWHRAQKTVQSLVEGRRRRPSLSDLAPSQQETLCGEFLRLPQAAALGLPRLAHLLLPTGRTMKDIDIIGTATDGKKLLAQVTLHSLEDSARKVDKLLPYRHPARAHLLFFCQCGHRTERKGVTIFPIQRAYAVFTSTRRGRVWLRRSA